MDYSVELYLYNGVVVLSLRVADYRKTILSEIGVCPKRADPS